MSTVLVPTWDGGGNAYPAYALALRLQAAGQRVVVMGWDSQESAVTALGLGFRAYPSLRPWPVGSRHEDVWEDEILPRLNGNGVRDDITRVASEIRAELVLVDCMMPASFDAVAELDVRSVVLMHLMLTRYLGGDDAQRRRARARLASVDRVLVLTPAGLERIDAVPGNVRFVGAVLPPSPAPPPPEVLHTQGDPWVLLSLSTTEMGQADALKPLLAALGSLPVRVLLTLGGVLRPAEIDAPANTTVVDFIEHRSVLPMMRAVVTHGGASTIAAALAFGVPLACQPQGRDQHDNAAVVAAAGAGVQIPEEAPAIDIARAIRTVLSEPQFAAAASGYRTEDPGSTALTAITDLLSGSALIVEQ